MSKEIDWKLDWSMGQDNQRDDLINPILRQLGLAIYFMSVALWALFG